MIVGFTHIGPEKASRPPVLLARHYGWYYGVLDKAKRNQPLSCSKKSKTVS